MKTEGDKGFESMNGRGMDLVRSAPDLGYPRAEHGAANPTAEVRAAEGRRNQASERDPASWVNWQSALYAFVLGTLCVFLVPLTSLWWIVPVLGVAAPVALVLLDGRGRGPAHLDGEESKEDYLRALAERVELTPAAATLSERELEILALLASGRTNAEIARDLFVALGTVKSHLNNIYRKLGAANRAEAATRAREMHLLR